MFDLRRGIIIGLIVLGIVLSGIIGEGNAPRISRQDPLTLTAQREALHARACRAFFIAYTQGCAADRDGAAFLSLINVIALS